MIRLAAKQGGREGAKERGMGAVSEVFLGKLLTARFTGYGPNPNGNVSLLVARRGIDFLYMIYIDIYDIYGYGWG